MRAARWRPGRVRGEGKVMWSARPALCLLSCMLAACGEATVVVGMGTTRSRWSCLLGNWDCHHVATCTYHYSSIHSILLHCSSCFFNFIFSGYTKFGKNNFSWWLKTVKCR
jgi:hypothetical protein